MDAGTRHTSHIDGGKLRSMMLDRGISQRELAAMVGVSQGTISNLLTGRRDVRVSAFKAVCDALEIDPKEVW